MNDLDRILKVLSFVVAVLTLYTLWESHVLHQLEYDEKCARRRARLFGGAYQ